MSEAKSAETKAPKPRVVEPERSQGEMRLEIPDLLVSASHPARLLWNVLGTVDLSAFEEKCGSVEGKAGRSLLSPRMLLTLWLYAISKAIGSAREIARLTLTEAAYRWIVGDLKVSHHKLSEFRVGYGEALNQLMTDVLASLMAKGLLRLELVAQDGTRTRAAASAPSFRTYGSLLQCREQAALHLKAVLAAAGDPEYTQAQHIRREAAAREYQERVEAAIKTVQELQKERSPKDKPARASTTDAEARVMKMGDGGFRPAYNVQYATAGSPLGGPRTIVGIQVTSSGSDMGSLVPMAEQVKERTGKLPETVMADGGHAKHEDIAQMEAKGIKVIVPVADNAKPLEQMTNADKGVLAWRQRMETPEAQQQYRARGGISELPNAHQKSHHGITQFLVRGLDKVTCVVFLSALSSDILQHATKLLT
jgi:transposase